MTLSGSGGAHGYWRVEQTLAAEWIERANVRLIHHLGDGADYASYDRNRFMRVPGTRNFKSGRYCQVVHADLTSRAYDARDLVGGLPDPPADDPRAPKRIRRREMAPSPRRSAISDPVDRWTPREYFAQLCGITEPDRDGKARCPLPDHDDPSASLWIGDTPEQGWFCFGCSRGGRIFDLASLLIGGPWGVDLRGDAFRAARAELERHLGVPIPRRIIMTPEQGWFCLHGDTRVMTWDGPRAIGELAGSRQRVLTTGGFWRDAPFLSFGRQRLQRIVLSRNGVEKEILATPEHRWFVVGSNGRDRGTRRPETS